MKIHFRLVLFGVAGHLIFASTGVGADFPKASIQVTVEDENGQPVDKAVVSVSGTMRANPSEAQKGSTGLDGKFTAEVRTNGEAGISARKTGYYDTAGATYNFRNLPGATERAFVTGHWEPETVFLKLRLNRVINPIAMYARQVRTKVPAQKILIGFDLFRGDFVPPYGHGEMADMLLRADIDDRSKNDYDSKLNVRFPNKGDGILPFQTEPPQRGSALQSPHVAPESGLLAEWSVLRSRRPDNPETSNYDPDRHAYFFRIRTVTDSKGKIVSAHYGKIYGDFMNFTYYLNPTPNDRNIEFDPKRNLFTDLKREEQVTAP